MTQDEWDAESMRMEEEEVAAREQAVRDMAPELATAVRCAVRMLVQVANHVPEHMMRNEWPVVESAFERLEEIERG